MAVENFKQKFDALVSKEPSKWLEKAQWRADNRGWIKISQAIAIRINRILREKQITQKALADLLSVSPQQISKIVKGRENLTLETISKLENALEATIIAVPRQSMHSKYQTEINMNTILDKKTELGKKKKNLSEMAAEYVHSDEKPNRYKTAA
jgi:plasmid maintenance system antidote protein VapI